MVVAGVVALTSVVSAVPVSADVSRVVYFPVQSNTVCDDTNYQYHFELDISNISNVSGEVTLYLYKKDGTLLTQKQPAGYGLNSDITPGTPININGNSTLQYTVRSGLSGVLPCEARPSYGKIEVNSNSAQFVATGEVTSSRSVPVGTTTFWATYNNTTVTINEGKPF
ncbi:hypothetical protein [Cohnella rhizosphaerae]|uniref:Uncharacterized protein n=1 Tax=Cohnella rhizosphaerae TaxID=1457232 RepID=A0A9X4KZN0_9BACL|nr:hypothetical protein [Cohnella rhizosphaerae]MDG0813406.1 hypothetical protein [Cohnella rhizosphaerae]